MADRTAKETKNEHTEKMGKELGEQFSQLSAGTDAPLCELE